MNKLALITNPALDPSIAGTGADAATSFGNLISTVIGGIIFAALLASIIFFLMGGFMWITAGGDKQRLETARDRIVNAIIGLIVTGSAWAITGFVANLFGFGDFPTLSLPTLGQ